MQSRSLAFIVLISACSGVRPPPDNADSPAPAPASAEPEPAKPPSAEIEPPAAKPGEASGASQLSEAALEAKVAPPPWKTIQTLTKSKRIATPVAASKRVAFGAHRFAAVMRVDDRRPKAVTHALHLVVVEESDGEWSLAGRLSLHEWSPAGDPQGDSIRVSLFASDYDWDERAELLVRYQKTIMCPGGGENLITNMVIVNVEKRLRIAFSTELHHSMASAPHELRGKARYEDVDGDGHPDVVISYRRTVFDDDDKNSTMTRHENRFIWRAERDFYEEDETVANRIERRGCDW